MPFMINCDNKGCMKSQEARLDIKNNSVLCAECGKEIKNITSFAKTQLKSMGQTIKNTQEKQMFAISCPSCELKAKPVLTGESFTCPGCKKELTNISEPFKLILKANMKNEPK